jgi:hypothetical protein
MELLKTTFACVAASLMLATTTAQAACTAGSMQGNWRVAIHATYSGGGFAGNCKLTIKPTGAYTGTCISVSLGQGPKSDNVSGKLNTNAKCEISGFMRAPNVHDSTVITGYLKGDSATFTAARDNPAIQVRMVVMVRE